MPVVNAVKCDQVKDGGCNRNGNRDSHQDDIYRPKQIGLSLIHIYIEKNGVRFHLSDGIQKFAGNKAVLSSGKEIPFDVLVVAVGVRPNTETAKEAGIRVNKGIVTDTLCRTSVKDIFAAGDCAESYDITSGTERPLSLIHIFANCPSASATIVLRMMFGPAID